MVGRPARFGALAGVMLIVVGAPALADPPTGGQTTSFTTWMMGLFNTAGWGAMASAYGQAVLGALLAISIGILTVRMLLEGSSIYDYVRAVSVRMVTGLVIFVLLLNYVWLMGTAVHLACEAGLGIGVGQAPGPGTATTLCAGDISPATILAQGADMANKIWTWQIPVPGAGGNFFVNLFKAAGEPIVGGLIAFTGWIVTWVCYALIALEMLGVTIESMIVGAVGQFFVAFAALEQTAELSQGTWTYIKRLAVRVFFIYLVVGVGVQLDQLTPAAHATVTMKDFLIWLLGTFSFAWLVFIASHKIPDAVISGNSSMSGLNDVVKPAATAALAVGGGAALAAGGAGLAAGGAMQAAKSVAGGLYAKRAIAMFDRQQGREASKPPVADAEQRALPPPAGVDRKASPPGGGGTDAAGSPRRSAKRAASRNTKADVTAKGNGKDSSVAPQDNDPTSAPVVMEHDADGSARSYVEGWGPEQIAERMREQRASDKADTKTPKRGKAAGRRPRSAQTKATPPPRAPQSDAANPSPVASDPAPASDAPRYRGETGGDQTAKRGRLSEPRHVAGRVLYGLHTLRPTKITAAALRVHRVMESIHDAVHAVDHKGIGRG